tara:strand:+ start:1641 stop:4349 length:2709 start_codon:yes stop_codon:yes gene_type:complete
MTPKEYKEMMDYLTRSGVKDKVKFASDINRPEPKIEVQEIEAINAFMRRNPRADGGMLVQPSADGSRPGYAKSKTKKGDKSLKYTQDPEFQKFYKEKGGNLYDAIRSFDSMKARKGKVVGMVELFNALGDDNPFAQRTLQHALVDSRMKITKNSSKIDKMRHDSGKKIMNMIIDILGEPTVLETINVRRPGMTKGKAFRPVFKIDKSKINKLNKKLNKYYNRVGNLGDNVIAKIIQFDGNKNLMQAFDNYDVKKSSIPGRKKGIKNLKGAIPEPSALEKMLIEEFSLSQKNPSYALMQLARAYRGEIQIKGIDKNLKRGNRIIKLLANNSGVGGPLGNAFLNWSKFQMAKYFDNPNASYSTITNSIRDSLQDIGIKNVDIDEIFPARTGTFTIGKGSSAYNQIVQFIDSKINREEKVYFDSKATTRYKKIIDNLKVKNFDEVNKLVNEHDQAIKNFYENNPQAKGKVKLTQLNYDPVKKRFLSPTEIYGKNVFPSKIQKDMDKFYRTTGLSLDVGSNVTLEQAAEGLKGDKKSQANILKKMGFKCKFAGSNGGLGSCDDPASYTDDINKTRQDLKSDDVRVRAAAQAKLNKGLQVAKTLPTIGKFLRRAGQATVGAVSSTLKTLGFTTPVGYAIEGIVEGGIYDYFKKQGYTDQQALAETFTPGLISGRPEGVPWYGGAESLLEKELVGDEPGRQFQPKVAQYVDALKDQEQVFDAFGRKEQGLQASRKDITDAASADIQDLNRSGTISRINRIMNPESMASRAYQTAVEKQAGRQDQRARDYMAENYVQTDPTDFAEQQFQKERNKAMLELFPPPTVEQVQNAYIAAGRGDDLKYFDAQDYRDRMELGDFLQKQDYFADNFRLEKAGGGIAKLAGISSGPPPESGPMSQGLQGLMKRVRNL